MMDREEIEALCDGAGGLGRQEVDDLLELHDAYVRLRDHRDASAADAALDTRAVASCQRNVRGRLCYLGREMPDGPWHREPDRVEFRHADLNCLLERSPNGAWCGYVEVPLGHAWQIVDDLTKSGVHGAISCIRPRCGLASGVDSIGFECDHTELGDLVPSHRSAQFGEYRDLAFARAKVSKMAAMVRDVEIRAIVAGSRAPRPG